MRWWVEYTKWEKFDMADFISWETKENKKNEDAEKKESTQDSSKVEESILTLTESEKNTFNRLMLFFKNKYTNFFYKNNYCEYDDDAQSAERIAMAGKLVELDTTDSNVDVIEDTTTIERIFTLISDDKTSDVVKYLLLYLYIRWKEEEGKRLQLEKTNSRLDESYRIISGLLQDKRGHDKFIGEIGNLLNTLKSGL